MVRKQSPWKNFRPPPEDKAGLAAFAREAHRQSRAIANSPEEADEQAFIDAITRPMSDEPSSEMD